MRWPSPLTLAAYGLIGLAVLLAVVYAEGRADGAAACVSKHAAVAVKVERQSSRARERVRQSIPKTDDINEILDWLGDDAIDKHY